MKFSDYSKIWGMITSGESEAVALVPNKNFVVTTGRLYKKTMMELNNDADSLKFKFDNLKDEAYYIRYREVVLAEVTNFDEFIDTVLEIFVEDIESLETALYNARQELIRLRETSKPAVDEPKTEPVEEKKAAEKKTSTKKSSTKATTTKKTTTKKSVKKEA